MSHKTQNVIQDVIFWVCFIALGSVLAFAAETYVQTQFLNTKPPVISAPHYDVGQVPVTTRQYCLPNDYELFDRTKFEACMLKGYPIGGDVIMPYDDIYLGPKVQYNREGK